MVSLLMHIPGRQGQMKDGVSISEKNAEDTLIKTISSSSYQRLFVSTNLNVSVVAGNILKSKVSRLYGLRILLRQSAADIFSSNDGIGILAIQENQ
jgi:hypothetical protein